MKRSLLARNLTGADNYRAGPFLLVLRLSGSQRRDDEDDFVTCLVVMAGGALGTLARYMISVWALPESRDLPWGTIIVNVTGRFIIGFSER